MEAFGEDESWTDGGHAIAFRFGEIVKGFVKEYKDDYKLRDIQLIMASTVDTVILDEIIRKRLT